MFDKEKASIYVKSHYSIRLKYLIADILVASRGNHATILEFLERVDSYEIEDKMDFLLNLSAKDLRDITTEVINDHYEEIENKMEFVLRNLSAEDLRNMTTDEITEMFDSIAGDQSDSSTCFSPYIRSRYIRNPRVANEMLTPYRSFFRNQCRDTACCVLTSEASTCNINQLPYTKEAYQNNPMLLVDWVRKNITIDPECNLGGAPIQPMGVWHARTADALSRDIFFVALARSLDIPARIDEVTGKVQLIDPTNSYIHEIFTTDINFESEEQTTTPQGKLIATFQPTKTQSDPKYYYHFTISKINDDGTLQLLNYDEGESGMEQGAAWSNLLKNGTNLDCGNYLMVTGSRLANGGVLAEMNFFTIEENQTTTTELVMRQSTDQVQVIGSFNSESLYTKSETQDNSQHSILSTTGRGYYVIGIIGYGDEPTNHALRDIATVANEFNAWGRPMILLSPSTDLANKTFSSNLISTLNTQLTNLNFGIDTNGSIQEQIIREMKLTNTSLPIFIIADTFNRVVFCSQGYTIGLGEQLIKTIHQLEN